MLVMMKICIRVVCTLMWKLIYMYGLDEDCYEFFDLVVDFGECTNFVDR